MRAAAGWQKARRQAIVSPSLHQPTKQTCAGPCCLMQAREAELTTQLRAREEEARRAAEQAAQAAALRPTSASNVPPPMPSPVHMPPMGTGAFGRGVVRGLVLYFAGCSNLFRCAVAPTCPLQLVTFVRWLFPWIILQMIASQIGAARSNVQPGSTPHSPPHPTHLPSPAPADMGGAGSPSENVREPPNTKKMTVQDMKQWLMVGCGLVALAMAWLVGPLFCMHRLGEVCAARVPCLCACSTSIPVVRLHSVAVCPQPAFEFSTPLPLVVQDHGHEAQVWEMSSKKAKKADWEAAILRAF